MPFGRFPNGEELLLVVAWTVVFSVALHGATAYPLSQRYGAWFAQHGRDDMAEAQEVEMMPTR